MDCDMCTASTDGKPSSMQSLGGRVQGNLTVKLIGMIKTQHQMVMNRESFTPAAVWCAVRMMQRHSQFLQQLHSQHLWVGMFGFDHRTNRLPQAKVQGDAAAAQQA
jgi:hypothetical protein